MNSNRKKIIWISVSVVILIFITFIIFKFFNLNNTCNILLVNKNSKNIAIDNNVEESNNNDKMTDEIISDESDSNIVGSDNEKLNIDEDIDEELKSQNDKDDNENLFSEGDVVSYFEKMGDEVETSGSFKEKFKKYFVIIIDFIFYNEEINGYTFGDLSSTAKAKIISIALKIDNKIEAYIPNYKENITSTGNKIYIDIKDKLIILYMDISTDVCNNNDDGCNKVKEIFKEIKDVCNIGWDFVKGLFQGGFSKVKDWYEIYSGK